MLQEFKEFVEDTTLKMARKLLGYSGSSKMLFNGVWTHSMKFADGSLYVVETCGDLAVARATGPAAEWYQLLLRLINATEL